MMKGRLNAVSQKGVDKINMGDDRKIIAVCSICKKAYFREKLRYISKFPFIYCEAACDECRAKIQKSKLRKLFVRFH